MRHIPWIVVLFIVFFVGSWAGTKYPATNLIAKVTG
jgi:hypothetical protein